jgi:hypothetical protein
MKTNNRFAIPFFNRNEKKLNKKVEMKSKWSNITFPYELKFTEQSPSWDASSGSDGHEIPHYLQDTSVHHRVHNNPQLDHILAEVQPKSSSSVSFRFSSVLPSTPRIKTFLSSMFYLCRDLVPGNRNTSIINTSFSTPFHNLKNQISLSKFIYEYKHCFSCKIIGYIPLIKLYEY